MSAAELVYAWLMTGLRPFVGLAAHGPSKVARSVRGQLAARSRMERWAHAHRDPERPLLWLHAPSVGEGLQTRAVIEQLQTLRPELQLVFTHYSPSAEGLAARMPVDFAGYLPPDTPAAMRRAVQQVRPSAIVFTKTELWPMLSLAAERADIPTVLIAGTLPRSSSRRTGLAAWLLRPAHRRLTLALAVGAEDRARLVELGARAERTFVTGDPGIDSAAQRSAAARAEAPWLKPFTDRRPPTLVVGSSWPADERVLLTALESLRTSHPDLRLVIAPHEPTEDHLAPLEHALERGGWRSARLSTVEARGALAEAQAVVVDRVGVLAELYTVGTMALVGGGFHSAGLHSVLEPAAAGLPVLFGPAHDNAVAAAELIKAGGARSVRDATELAATLREWLDDPLQRARFATAARAYIEEHQGAALRTAKLLLDQLPPVSREHSA